MPWWVLPAISAATSAAGHYLNKPKQKQADTTYYDRLINNIKGGVAKRDYRRSMADLGMHGLNKAKRVADESLKYSGGSEAYQAAAQLKQNSNYLENATEISLEAAAGEAKDNAAKGDQIAELDARREAMIEEERQRYADQIDAWKQEGTGLAINAIGNFAGAGVNNAMTNAENAAAEAADQAAADQAAADQANKAREVVNKGLDAAYDVYLNSFNEPNKSPLDRDTFGKMYEESGFTTPKGYGNHMKMPEKTAGDNVIDVDWTDDGGNKHRGTYDRSSLANLGVIVNPGDKSITIAKAESEGMIEITKYDEATDSYVKYEVPESEFKAEFGDAYPDGTKSVRIGKPGADTSGAAEESLIDLRNNIEILSGDQEPLLTVIDDVDNQSKKDIAGAIKDYAMNIDIPDGGMSFTTASGELLTLGTGKDITSKRRSLYNGLVKYLWEYKDLSKSDGGGMNLAEEIENLGL